MSYNLDNDYDMKGSSNGLDSQISDLKTRLFDLEQQEKRFQCFKPKISSTQKRVCYFNQYKE